MGKQKDLKKLANKYISKTPLPEVEAIQPDAVAVKPIVKQKKQIGKYEKIDSTIADVIRTALPAWMPDNVKQLSAKMIGDARMSNKSLSDKQKVMLWDVIQQAKKRTGTADGGTEYEDYATLGMGSADQYDAWFNRGNIGLVEGVKNSYLNPGFTLASTVGRGGYWTDPENPKKIYYTDVYDWNPGEKYFAGNKLYQVVRNNLRAGEDQHLNKEKNNKFRMNFEFDADEIERLRQKIDRPFEHTLDRNGGWLEKYNDGGPVQENYNDYSVTVPPNYKGEGYFNEGRDYSPAWGGQFEDGGQLPTAQVGRNTPATRSDSLALYNNSKAISNYYNKRGYVQFDSSKELQQNLDKIKNKEKEIEKIKKDKSRSKESIDQLVKGREKAIKGYKERIEQLNPKNYLSQLDKSKRKFEEEGTTGGIDKEGNRIRTKIPLEEFYKPIDENTFNQREQSFGFLDLRSPMPLYDRRITPQNLSLYSSLDSIKSDDLYEQAAEEKDPVKREELYKQADNYENVDHVQLYGYDPLAVMPWDMMSIDQQQKRIRKYGLSGAPSDILKKHPEWTGLVPNNTPNSTVDITTPTQTVVPTKPEATPKPKYTYTYGKPLFKGGPQTDYYTTIDENGNVVNTSEFKTSPYEDGGPVKRFMQPTETFKNFGYNPKEKGWSTEYSTSIGGPGEVYLVPGYRQGRLLNDPEATFNMYGEHLGGPFKTVKAAEDFAKFRHDYVEKNKNIPSPFKTRDYAMGGSVNMPTIKDKGSFNKDGVWIPDWKAMAAQAKKLGAKKVKTDRGGVINFNDKWEAVSADDSNNMAMGGSIGGATQGIPGATGFMYARTGSIPDNGKYAKKTKASAQDGTTMSSTSNKEKEAQPVSPERFLDEERILKNTPQEIISTGRSPYRFDMLKNAVMHDMAKEQSIPLDQVNKKEAKQRTKDLLDKREKVLKTIPIERVKGNPIKSVYGGIGGYFGWDEKKNAPIIAVSDNLNAYPLDDFKAAVRHESRHAYDYAGQLLTDYENDLIKSKIDKSLRDDRWNAEQYDQMSIPTEIMGRIQEVHGALRDSPAVKILDDSSFEKPTGSFGPKTHRYDPTQDKVKLEYLKSIQNNSGYQDLIRLMKPKDIVELMNTIAANDLQQGIPIAQKGGKYSKQIPKEIPKVTTTKFLPPIIKHDEEVTKPEPAPEETISKPTYTDPDALTPEQIAKQEAERKAYLEELERQIEERRKREEITDWLSEMAMKQRQAEEENEAYRNLDLVSGTKIRDLEKRLDTRKHSPVSDYAINRYHYDYDEARHSRISLPEVLSLRKSIAEYVNSPLYAKRQTNYPETYSGESLDALGLDQNEFQNTLAREKRNARLKQLNDTTLEIASDKRTDFYNPEDNKISLSDYNDMFVAAHEIGHSIAHDPYVKDESGKIIKDATGESLYKTNHHQGSDKYNSEYFYSINSKDKDLNSKLSSNPSFSLNQNEINRFVNYASATRGQEEDVHYDKSSKSSQRFANEQYGDLQSFREMLYKYGITKSYGEDIDDKQVDKALKNKNITTHPSFKRFYQRYGFDGIRTLNNTIAANNPQQGIPVAQNGMEMSYYQNGLDFTPKSISKNGKKVIKDPKGQWAHPGEITQIPSNQITMQGVPYPVLGISDTGDTQMMYPNQEYQFIGDSVTEYPMMKQGGQLTKLDQLTNFTNYNTKQPGGWLDKYQ